MPAERLLLVDDDVSNRVTLAALLDAEGFVVDEAASHEGALAHLRASVYTRVILDWHLGDRTSADLVPTIRTTQPRARIVILTGSTHGLDPVALGVDAIATKGESFETLLGRL